jgi:indole-3-glycerol phosphate synthase
VRKAPAVRPFAEALARPGRINVVAEHKRRSPSRGAIREDLRPADVARDYEAAGAAAISVLTDEAFFGGRMAHLEEVRAATGLPVLRKDFVLDPWQVWEARAAGADAVLLIVAALTDADLGGLLAVAREAGLDALVEVHDRGELDRALASGSRLVGVNSRDLRTLAVSLDAALALAPSIPDDVVAVAESGIRTGADVRRLRDAGFDAFLVGEHLMGAPDPGRALKRLLEEAG